MRSSSRRAVSSSEAARSRSKRAFSYSYSATRSCSKARCWRESSDSARESRSSACWKARRRSRASTRARTWPAATDSPSRTPISVRTPEVSDSTCAVRSASTAEVVVRWRATGPSRASATLTGVGAASAGSSVISRASLTPVQFGRMKAAAPATPRTAAANSRSTDFRFMSFPNGWASLGVPVNLPENYAAGRRTLQRRSPLLRESAPSLVCAVSSAEEHLPYTQGVAGSNPAPRTMPAQEGAVAGRFAGEVVEADWRGPLLGRPGTSCRKSKLPRAPVARFGEFRFCAVIL